MGADADDVLAALDAVTDALAANGEATQGVLSRAEAMKEQRAQGRSYREILGDEERPLTVQLITEKLERLADAGSRLRRAQARALHREGLTTDQIARLFGVTRQRVSALLQHGREKPEPVAVIGDAVSDVAGSEPPAGGISTVSQSAVDLTEQQAEPHSEPQPEPHAEPHPASHTA